MTSEQRAAVMVQRKMDAVCTSCAHLLEPGTSFDQCGFCRVFSKIVYNNARLPSAYKLDLSSVYAQWYSRLASKHICIHCRMPDLVGNHLRCADCRDLHARGVKLRRQLKQLLGIDPRKKIPGMYSIPEAFARWVFALAELAEAEFLDVRHVFYRRECELLSWWKSNATPEQCVSKLHVLETRSV